MLDVGGSGKANRPSRQVECEFHFEATCPFILVLRTTTQKARRNEKEVGTSAVASWLEENGCDLEMLIEVP